MRVVVSLVYLTIHWDFQRVHTYEMEKCSMFSAEIHQKKKLEFSCHEFSSMRERAAIPLDISFENHMKTKRETI